MNALLPTATEIDTLLAADSLKALRPTVKDIAARLFATTTLHEVGRDRVFGGWDQPNPEYAILADFGHGRRSWQGLGTVRAAQAYLRGDMIRRII